MQEALRVAELTHSRKAEDRPAHGRCSNTDHKETFRWDTTDKLCWWQETGPLQNWYFRYTKVQ